MLIHQQSSLYLYYFWRISPLSVCQFPKIPSFILNLIQWVQNEWYKNIALTFSCTFPENNYHHHLPKMFILLICEKQCNFFHYWVISMYFLWVFMEYRAIQKSLYKHNFQKHFVFRLSAILCSYTKNIWR